MPAVLFAALVVVYPLVNCLILSTKQYFLVDPDNVKFIGLKNFVNLFSDKQFLAASSVTAIWTVVIVLFQLLLGLGISLVLNRHFFGRGFVRGVVLIPWVTTPVLVALMWVLMYDGNYGVFNDLLMKFGIIQNKVPWLSQISTALICVMIVMIWTGVPFFVLMLLASLQSIPLELYESASVDGASCIKKFFYITLPLIMPTLLITTLLRIIWVSNNVDVLNVMTGGGPGYATQTLSLYAYLTAQKSYNFGYASSMAVVWSMILGLFLVLYNILSEKLEKVG